MLDVISDIVDLAWNVSQSNKISKLNEEVDQLKQAARSAADSDPVQAQLAGLRAASAELRLYVAVLFRVLQQKGIVGRDDLVKLVEQVDGEDGRQDKAYAGDVLGPQG